MNMFFLVKCTFVAKIYVFQEKNQTGIHLNKGFSDPFCENPTGVEQSEIVNFLKY